MADIIDKSDKIFEYHPSDNVRLNIYDFDGPIATLHTMIVNDERFGSQYNIKTFPLHLVTDQFVSYLAQLEKFDMEIAGDFLKIATDLLRLKAAALIKPAEEIIDEDDYDLEAEEALRRRLIIYDIVVKSVGQLKAREKLYRINRKPKYTDADAIIVIDKFNMTNLLDAYGQVLLRIDERDEAMKIKRVQPDKYPLETQVKKVANLLKEKPKRGFYEFFDKNVEKSEVISTFEAILRMIAKQFVVAEQEEKEEMQVQLREEFVGQTLNLGTIIAEEEND